MRWHRAQPERALRGLHHLLIISSSSPPPSPTGSLFSAGRSTFRCRVAPKAASTSSTSYLGSMTLLLSVPACPGRGRSAHRLRPLYHLPFRPMPGDSPACQASGRVPWHGQGTCPSYTGCTQAMTSAYCKAALPRSTPRQYTGILVGPAGFPCPRPLRFPALLATPHAAVRRPSPQHAGRPRD